MQDSTRALFISWFPFHGRSDGIARSLGVRAWFSDGGRGPAAVRDIRRWRETISLLRTERPDVVIVMQPPVIALWCVWWYARRSGTRIAGDLHTGVFTEPGSRLVARHTLRLLARHGMAIVTNDALRSVAEENTCPALVLHDRIEGHERDFSRPDDPDLARIVDTEFVIVPLAYAHDEPIDEILEAARLTTDIRWVLTGRPPRRVVARAPGNVEFSGFLTHRDFHRAMSRAAVVLAMTKHEHTMQRAAYEALSLGRPLVTSDTEVLVAYYAGAAELAEPRGASMAAAVRRALADASAAKRMTALRDRRIAEQERALDELRRWVAARGR